MKRNPKSRRAVVALVFMSLIWGYNWVIVKQALRFAPPFDFAFLRTLGGGLVLLSLLALKGRSVRPRNIPMLILVGLLCTTGSVGLSVWALVEGGAGKMAILVYTMPFWLIGMAWPLLGERPGRLQWAAFGLALAGILLLVEPWDYKGDAFPSVLAVLGGICWAASAVAARYAERMGEVDVMSLSAWQQLFGAVGIFAASLAVPSPPIVWTAFFTGALVYNILLTSGVAVFLWFYVLKELPTGLAGLGSLMTPVIGVLAAAVQLGERPTATEAGGIVLILSALALLAFGGNLRRRS